MQGGVVDAISLCFCHPQPVSRELAPIPQEPEELLEAIRAEAKRVEEDALYSHATHNEAARGSYELHYWLAIPAAVVAAAAGVFSISGGTSATLWQSVLGSIVSFSAAMLAGVTAVLDPKSQSAAHHHAANAYAALRGDARVFAEIECRKQKPLEELDHSLAALRERNRKLDADTPVVSEHIRRKANAKIWAGVYDYAVDKPSARPTPPQASPARAGA
jgi:hypothetical protein